MEDFRRQSRRTLVRETASLPECLGMRQRFAAAISKTDLATKFQVLLKLRQPLYQGILLRALA